MTDSIISALKTSVINSSNISFDLLREYSSKNHNIWGELGRGRAILTNFQQLDQYLYSYGLMTKSQWQNFLGSVMLPPEPIRIVDYGCGQGLGLVLLLDHFGPALANRVVDAILIEPSDVALARAQAILSCYCSNSIISKFNTKLDELPANYLPPSDRLSTVHIFSNILDIQDFDHGRLFNEIFSVSGHHIILAVSHDRDFEGGSQRIHAINEQIVAAGNRGEFSLLSSDVKQFNCLNGQPAISWQLHCEIPHESV